MLEIDKYLIDLIVNDTNISTLLGSTTEDNRIYIWNPDTKITYSPTNKSALFYSNSQIQRTLEYYAYPSQVGDIIYRFYVNSLDYVTNETLSEYLIKLLSDIAIETTNYRILKILLISNNYLGNIGTDTFIIYNRQISFLLHEVFDKTKT